MSKKLFFLLLIGATITIPAVAQNTGCISGNCVNGYGAYAFENGNKYVGNFLASAYNGQGTYTTTAGDKYVGTFADGKFNGQGTYSFATGDKYVGTFTGAEFNGQGTLTYATGDKYVGSFAGGKFNGQGTLTYANGDKYVGTFAGQECNGQGTFTYANGTINKGTFVNNEFTGQISADDENDPTYIDDDGIDGQAVKQFTDFQNLNNNHTPAGWSFGLTQGTGNISNGRLNSVVVNGGAKLERSITIPAKAWNVTIEWDASMRYTLWGGRNFLTVTVNGKTFDFINEYNKKSTYGDANTSFIRFNGKNLSTKTGAADFSDFHYEVQLTDNNTYYTITRISDGTVVFEHALKNYTINSEYIENGGMILSDITTIQFNTQTTTDNDLWLDNLSIKVE